jgi:hypothetical protein
MADLNEAADQFAKDLIAQNIAGLMMVFTPEGMGKAMAMQAQMQGGGQPQPAATGFEIRFGGQDGVDQLVDVAMKNADGEAVITTRWRDIAGAWEVNDIALKQ